MPLTCSRGSLLCSVVLFALCGSRIMRTRAQVRRVQSICYTENQPRKFSMASFGSLAWQNTRRKSFGSHDQPSFVNLSFGFNGREEEVPVILTPPTRIHSKPELLVISDYASSNDSAGSPSRHRSMSEPTALLRRSSRFENMHWKYARFAVLCCFVLLVTWVPISCMRIYNNFINPHHPIIALYYASAVCIPLQGFGNFLVYVTNNWSECQGWTIELMTESWFTVGARPKRSMSDGSASV